QDAQRGGVERADPQPGGRGPDDALDAPAHLARGAVRERERQHRLGGHAPLEKPRDAAGQDARLAGAGASDHQDGPALVLDGLLLSGIERRRRQRSLPGGHVMRGVPESNAYARETCLTREPLVIAEEPAYFTNSIS